MDVFSGIELKVRMNEFHRASGWVVGRSEKVMGCLLMMGILAMLSLGRLFLMLAVVLAIFGGNRVAGKNTGKRTVDRIVVDLGTEAELKVRLDAVNELGDISSPEAVETLCKVCEDKDVIVRVAAIRALRKVGDQRGLPTAVRCLSDRYEVVRREAAEAVTTLSDNPEREWRLILATSSEEHTTAMALRSLRKLESAGVTEEIRRAAHHSSKFVRMEAALGLASLGEEADIQLLRELAKDNEIGVRISVGEACTILKDVETAISIAGPLLNDDAQSVRWAMINQLVKIGSEKVAYLYLDVLRNEEQEDLRIRAANLLPKSKDITGVLGPLRQITNGETDERVKAALESAILRIKETITQESHINNIGLGPADGGFN